jgi:hypothetical protein
LHQCQPVFFVYHLGSLIGGHEKSLLAKTEVVLHSAAWPGAELILDWYRCRKKCHDLTSLICRGRVAKAKLLRALLLRLWRGQLDDAIALLEAYRPQAKDTESLDKLITYLSDRRAYLPNYKERRAQRQYIGSAHTEKANDLIVARRQKHQGMHWSEATRDALAALRTLLLNGGWDLLAEAPGAPAGCAGRVVSAPSVWRANKPLDKVRKRCYN